MSPLGPSRERSATGLLAGRSGIAPDHGIRRGGVPHETRRVGHGLRRDAVDSADEAAADGRHGAIRRGRDAAGIRRREVSARATTVTTAPAWCSGPSRPAVRRRASTSPRSIRAGRRARRRCSSTAPSATRPPVSPDSSSSCAGPNVTVSQKEASGLGAIVTAIDALRLGRARALAAGGVDAIFDIFFRVHDRVQVMATADPPARARSMSHRGRVSCSAKADSRCCSSVRSHGRTRGSRRTARCSASARAVPRSASISGRPTPRPSSGPCARRWTTRDSRRLTSTWSMPPRTARQRSITSRRRR